MNVSVKRLVWRYPFGRTSGEILAETTFGAAYALRERGPVWELVCRGSHLVFGVGRYASEQQAKVAAQSDYDRRILGALENNIAQKEPK